MPEDQSTRSAPDQNDPTGHTRAGSPTYHPGNPPSNNLRVSAEPDASLAAPAHWLEAADRLLGPGPWIGLNPDYRPRPCGLERARGAARSPPLRRAG